MLHCVERIEKEPFENGKKLEIAGKTIFLNGKKPFEKKIGKGTIKKWYKNSFKKIGENLLNI